jgi:hypothetical protein
MYSNSLECSDDYASETDAIGDAADTIAEYAVIISEQIGDLPTEAQDMADLIAEEGKVWVDRGGMALALLGIIYSVFGLLGTMCYQGQKDPCRIASCLLASTNAAGVLMLIIIALLLCAELLVGLSLGDFCAADVGPSNALVAMMESQVDDDDATGLFKYYATCDGTNPMNEYLDIQQEAVTNMTTILDDYKDLFIHDTMCCNASIADGGTSISTDDLDVDKVDRMCTFYSSSNPDACTADTLCDYNGDSVADDGICAAAGGCSNTSYAGIVNDITYLAIDDDGPLVGFFSEFACSEINPKIATMVNDVMCDDLVASFWWLVATHISVLIIMFFTMIWSSFARQVVMEVNMEQSEDKNGDMKGVIPDGPKHTGTPEVHQHTGALEIEQEPGLPMLPMPKH